MKAEKAGVKRKIPAHSEIGGSVASEGGSASSSKRAKTAPAALPFDLKKDGKWILAPFHNDKNADHSFDKIVETTSHKPVLVLMPGQWLVEGDDLQATLDRFAPIMRNGALMVAFKP
ncbi:MAG: hypothetical protein SGARI_002897 [Bacillariaceae sp.]